MSADSFARSLRAVFVAIVVIAVAVPSSAQVFGYITDNLDRTISVINTRTDTVVATIDLGIPYPYGVACHPDGTRVYVSGTGVAFDGTVYLIDVATQNWAGSVAVGKSPQGLAVLPDGSRLYVANGTDDTVSVIDTSTFTVTGTVPLDESVEPYGVVAHPDSSTVYVSNYVGSSVSVIDVATGTVTTTIPVQAKPRGITIDPDGDYVYVANSEADSVSVIDTATNSVIDTIIVGGINADFPYAVAIHPDGGTLYVSLHRVSTSTPISSVAVVDTATRSQTLQITGFWSALGLSVHPAGDRLYVVDGDLDAVQVVDTGSNTIVDTVPVGYGPFAFGDFFIRTLIFADGFGSGDLTAWSARVP
jgi:YVTN family beta-propeller protein